MIRFFEQTKAFPEISCFYTDRHGGYSKGAFGTFNCNSYCGDDVEAVRRNRMLLTEALQSGTELVIPHQTHSANVFAVDDKYINATAEQRTCMTEGVDAVMTNVPGYAVCVSTADCIPVLMYDKRRKVAASVHAGWRGTVRRIVECTVDAMRKRYGSMSEDIVACIGPGISAEAFEIGEEVYTTFESEGFYMPSISFKNSTTGKWHIDLVECNRLQLMAAGIGAESIECCGICTYSNYEDFFSARRLTIHSGRILSGILIKK